MKDVKHSVAGCASLSRLRVQKVITGYWESTRNTKEAVNRSQTDEQRQRGPVLLSGFMICTHDDPK